MLRGEPLSVAQRGFASGFPGRLAFAGMASLMNSGGEHLFSSDGWEMISTGAVPRLVSSGLASEARNLIFKAKASPQLLPNPVVMKSNAFQMSIDMPPVQKDEP